MLGVYLARILEGKEGSPFKGHVKLALLEEDDERMLQDGSEPKWQVSIACLVEGVTRLISERPAADRSALASGKIKDRSQLEADSTPLRELYIGGKDKTLLELITTYFGAVDELLWQGQSKGSFINRTVGVLALFDVLRDALKVKAIDIEDMPTSALALFQNARGINFGDDYFHASGAGRVRIRNVLKALIGLPSKADPAVTEAAIACSLLEWYTNKGSMRIRTESVLPG